MIIIGSFTWTGLRLFKIILISWSSSNLIVLSTYHMMDLIIKKICYQIAKGNIVQNEHYQNGNHLKKVSHVLPICRIYRDLQDSRGFTMICWFTKIYWNYATLRGSPIYRTWTHDIQKVTFCNCCRSIDVRGLTCLTWFYLNDYYALEESFC